MRNAGILFGVVLAFALSCTNFNPADPFNPNADITGTWGFNYKWSSGTSWSNGHFYFQSDKTFSTESGNNGTWSTEGTSVTITYSSGTVYSGTANSGTTSITGTMTSYSGSTGEWNATKE
jgi:hypothetical protein